MAEENKIVLEVDVKPLKKQLREATQELQLARQQFGEYSDEALKAAQKVAMIRDEIESANEAAQLFDPGKRFQALTTAASTAAAGIAAVQGAMALFGNESEDVEKALLKVQGALALSQGLSQLKDIGKVGEQLQISFRALTASVNNFKAALITTGIGALVVSVGLIVAYWEEIKDLVSGTSARIQKQNDLLNDQITTNDENLAILESTKQLSVLRGESEVEINAEIEKQLMLQQESYKQLIASLELQLENEKSQARQVTFWEKIKIGVASAFGIYAQAYATADAYNQTTEKALELEKKLKEAKEKALGVDIKLATQQKEDQDKANKAAEEAKKQMEKQMQAEAILQEARVKMFDKQKQEEYAVEQAYAEKFKQLKEAGVKDDGSLEAAKQKELQDIRDKYLKEDLEKEKDFQKQLNEMRMESRLAGIRDENEKARQQILIEFEKRRQELLDNEKLTGEQRIALGLELAQQEQQALAALQLSIDQQQAEYDLADLEREMTQANLSFQIQRDLLDQKEALLNEQFQKGLITETAYTEAIRENADARIEIDKKEADAKVENAARVSGLLAGVADLVGKNTAAGKATAIAATTIDTYLGAQKAYTSQLIPGDPSSPIRAALAAALAVAGGIKNVRAIVRTPVPGGKGGASAPDVSAPAPGVVPAVPTLGTSPVTALGQVMQNQPPLRAYVVESDVTGTQKRVADIERRAGF
jgi:hypothetical protein